MLPRCPPWHSRHHRPPLNLPASQISAGWRLMPLWAPWLRLHSVRACFYVCLCVYAKFVHILFHDNIHNSKGSLLDGYHAERKSLFLPFDPLGSVLCMVMGFQGAEHFSVSARCIPPTLLYITLLDGGIEKKTKGRRKEPVFHPISLERQCCALVIV